MFNKLFSLWTFWLISPCTILLEAFASHDVGKT